MENHGIIPSCIPSRTNFSIKGILRVLGLLAFLMMQPGILTAHHPKTHMYTALQIIYDLEHYPGVVLNGDSYAVDQEIRSAILRNKGAFLAGAIGPDAFPDIAYGQMIIHPDRKCSYSETGEADCSEGGDDKTWSYEWLEHIFRCAQSALNRPQALAFAYGFLIHTAGDMWGHTFANEYAGGSWPDNYTDAENLKIIVRHILVEGVVKSETPAIRQAVDDAGGLGVSSDFLYTTFIQNDWARSHGGGSFINLLEDIRDKIASLDPGKPTMSAEDIAAALFSGGTTAATQWLWSSYIECWVAEFDRGLRQWPQTSILVAESLFVADNTDAAIDHLRDYYENYIKRMVNTQPDLLLNSCVLGLPGWVTTLLTPEIMVNAIGDKIGSMSSEILDELVSIKEITSRIENYMFEKAFGISPDQIKAYFSDPKRYFDPSEGFFESAGTLNEIEALMGDYGGYFQENQFAPVHNTIVMGKLSLLSPGEMDGLLFRYHVGTIYTNPDYHESVKKSNVMRGFMKSLDGNHQWRNKAPGPPNHEPNRSFSTGMPLWEDFLARKNFFKKFFSDWVSNGHSVFGNDDACREISHLPPVSIFGPAVTEMKTNECQSIHLIYQLINHQRRPQPIYLCPTIEVRNIGSMRRCDHEHLLPPLPAMIPGAPDSILFLRIVTDTLAPAADKIEIVSDTVRLPNCYPLSSELNIYFLEGLYSPVFPLIEYNYPIKPNDIEGLLDEPVSLLSYRYSVVCEPEKCSDLPLCDTLTNQQPAPGLPGDSTGVTHPPGTGSSTGTTVPAGSAVPSPGSGIIVPSSSGIIRITCRDDGCFDFTWDADGDNIPNRTDNCPVRYNPRQTDDDADGRGNACDFTDNLVHTMTQLPGFNYIMTPAQIAIFEIIGRELRNSGLITFPGDVPIRPGPLGDGGGTIPFKPEHYKFIGNQFRNLRQMWSEGRVSHQEYISTIAPLLTGLFVDAPGYKIRDFELGRTEVGRGRPFVSLNVQGTTRSAVRIIIPRSIMDCRSYGGDESFTVSIDGKKANAYESRSKNARILSIPIGANIRTIRIIGTSFGPERRQQPH